MLAEVDEIGEDEFQVLSRGLHNQPGAFDAARLLVLGEECLWVAFLGPVTMGQGSFERPLPCPG